MKKRILFFLLFLMIQTIPLTLHAAISDWKAYMAYHDVQEIEQAGNLVFVQASNNLYVYNQNDQSIQTFSKMDYLSDCDIQHIAYNKSAKRLLILYKNANIDLMNINNYEVQNLSDYYSASMTENKTVNTIYMYGNDAYLCTGFGIVKINVKEAEISETYQLGYSVDWCEIKNNQIYAYAKQLGTFCASLNANLLNKNNWKRVGEYVNKTVENQNELKQLISTLNPGGPKYNHFWFMKFTNNQLYTCGGAFLSGLTTAIRPGCIQIFNNSNWTILPDDIASITGYPYQDINCVEPDSKDPNHIFASGRTGLYEFQDGKLLHYYNKDNSILEGAVDNGKVLGNDYVLVHSLLSDNKGSLWLLNSQTQHNSIIEFTQDHQFISHHKDDLMANGYSFAAMQGLLFDQHSQIWFVNDNHQEPAIVRYRPQSEEIKIIKQPFSNQDGASLNLYYANCIQEDKEGNLWIGTDVGPLCISALDATSDDITLQQIKVPRNDGTNYADYLLNGVNISAIAIDGGNRKWLGTKGNGVYLIDVDNTTEIHHFTSTNSPLLSDYIESIAINGSTGEVFFGTDKGLCSYQSDASTPSEEMKKEEVWAYPNPVRPDYTGLITITGLSFDTDIKIVTTNGTLVNQGRSNGGTYTWDGNDMKGRKVSSGVYMIETATSDGNKGVVCKIAIVR